MWQLQAAKQRFSEVVRLAEAGEPQIVTRHGQAIVVVVDVGLFRHLRGTSDELMGYLRGGSTLDVDLAIERPRERPREIDLTG